MATRRIAETLCVLALVCGVIHAQGTSSNIMGTVTDSSGASVPGAEIQIRDAATGAVRSATSGMEGLFQITNLPAGGYSVTVRATGFRTYAQQGLNLSAQETRHLGRLQLAVGSQVEEVSVTAVATPVQ